MLEVGTGCGYQTAVLAPLVTNVYSVERIAALQLRARQVLRDLRISNVFMRHGDGFEGWPPYAPFDGILVAAARWRCRPRCSSSSATAAGWSSRSAADREQQLLRITRRGERYEREVLGAVDLRAAAAGARLRLGAGGR